MKKNTLSSPSMTTVIYARYSDDKQQEISIEGQLRVCRNYCEQQGYTVVGTYIDRALSASKNVELRAEFQRMIRDSASHTFDTVVVYKFSRFARNRYDSAIYKARLRQNGVRVLSACEPISDNPEGALIEGIFESLDEFYSKSLAQDVSRGMYENATKGLSTGGTIPYGYKTVNKVYKLDEATYPAAKLALTMYADGHSCQAIANVLNQKGYRTAKGKPFTKNSFSAMFGNPKYIGTYHYNDQVELPGQIPAIIDRDTHQRILKRLHDNKNKKRTSARDHAPYILSSKLFCGSCGRPFAGDCGNGRHGGRYYYYTCSGKKRALGCRMPSISRDKLDKLIVDHSRALLEPETVKRVASAAYQEYRKQYDDNSEAIALRSRLEETSKSIENIVRVIEQGAFSAALSKRLSDLEALKDVLSIELADAERKLPRLSELDILRWLSSFSVGDSTDEDFARNIVDILVNSIHIYKNPNAQAFKIIIAYNLTDESEEVLGGSDLLALVHHHKHRSNPIIYKTYLIFDIAA